VTFNLKWRSPRDSMGPTYTLCAVQPVRSGTLSTATLTGTPVIASTAGVANGGGPPANVEIMYCWPHAKLASKIVANPSRTMILLSIFGEPAAGRLPASASPNYRHLWLFIKTCYHLMERLGLHLQLRCAYSTA